MRNFDKKYNRITYRIDHKLKIEKIVAQIIYKYISY